MEEKYKKFLEIDWANNSDWHLYFSNITPTPPGNKVLYFKKRFYRLKIDADFDINYEPQQKASSNTQQQSTFTKPTFTSYHSNTTFGKLISAFETLLWIISIALLVSFNAHALKFALLVLLFRIFKRVGRPRFNIEYAQSLFLDEHLHLFLFQLLLLLDRLNQFTLVPFYITSLLDIFDCLRTYNIMSELSNKIINKRVMLCELKANADIFIGFLLIIGYFFGTNSFLMPIFFWQFLRFKYIFNSDTNLAFRRFNNIVNKYKNHLPSPLKYPITKVQELFSYLGRTEAKDGEKAGGANCSIF